MDSIKALLRTKQKLFSLNKDKVAMSKLHTFEQLLLENEDADDDKMCHLLYGNCRKTSTYRTLKFRYEEQLMNEIFALSSNVINESTYSFKTILAAKNFTIALTLHKLGGTEDAIRLFNKNYNFCKKYSLTNMALLNVKPLYYHYAFVNPNVKLMNRLLQESEEFMEIFKAEKFMENCNAIISNMYVMNKGGMSKHQLANVKVMIDEILLIRKNVSSRNIDILSYDLCCFYYMVTGDYIRCIEMAREGLKKTEGSLEFDQLFKSMCITNLALSNFHLNNFKVSERWFLKAIALIPKGTRKWFHETSRYFVVLVRLKAYEKLVPLYLEVKQYKTIKKYEFIFENWLIIEAVIHFLIDLGKIKLSKSEQIKLPEFSVNKFINSVPFFSKDKKGQYITIHIIKILFLLQKSKYDQIINLSDSLNQYTYKYLKNDETLRSNCFIKMILKMVKTGFHPVRTQAHVKPLLQRMTSSKVVIDERSSEVEIIPYEELWSYIIEIISSKKKY